MEKRATNFRIEIAIVTGCKEEYGYEINIAKKRNWHRIKKIWTVSFSKHIAYKHSMIVNVKVIVKMVAMSQRKWKRMW